MNENQILAAMASASPDQQVVLRQRLAALRAQGSVQRGPVVPAGGIGSGEHLRHTAATDWLDKVAASPASAREVAILASAEATKWLGTKSALVRSNASELRIQAEGYAAHWAGQYGPVAREASAAFMASLHRLAGTGDQTDDVMTSPVEEYDDYFDEDRKARVRYEKTTGASRMASLPTITDGTMDQRDNLTGDSSDPQVMASRHTAIDLTCPVCGKDGGLSVLDGKPCMACIRSRQQAAMDGKCHCGKQRIEGDERSVGSRRWIPCERCLGTIRQTGSRTAAAGDVEQVTDGRGEPKWVVWETENNQAGYFDSADDAAAYYADYVRGHQFTMPEPGTASDGWSLGTPWRPSPGVPRPTGSLKRRSNKTAVQLPARAETLIRWLENPANDGKNSDDQTAELDAILTGMGLNWGFGTGDKIKVITQEQKDQIRQRFPDQWSGWSERRRMLDEFPDVRTGSRTAAIDLTCPVCGKDGGLSVLDGKPCMACIRSRQQAAMDGKCHCGKQRIEGDERSVGSRRWIPCERCLGTIRQTGSRTAAAGDVEQVTDGRGEPKWVVWETENNQAGYFDSADDAAAYYADYVRGHQFTMPEPGTASDGWSLGTPWRPSPGVPRPTGSLKRRSNKTAVQLPARAETLIRWLENPANDGKNSDDQTAELDAILTGMGLNWGFGTGDKIKVITQEQKDQIRQRFPDQWSGWSERRRMLDEFPDVRTGSRTAAAGDVDADGNIKCVNCGQGIDWRERTAGGGGMWFHLNDGGEWCQTPGSYMAQPPQRFASRRVGQGDENAQSGEGQSTLPMTVEPGDNTDTFGVGWIEDDSNDDLKYELSKDAGLDLWEGI